MALRFRDRLLPDLKRREILIILTWAAAIASLYAQALYQRTFLTPVDHVLVFTVCIVAGAVLADIGHALLGYVASMIIGIGVVVGLTVMPVPSGNFNLVANELINQLWILALFKALFPFPFIAYLVGSIIGSAIGERYFY